MLKSIEAVVEPDGTVCLTEPVQIAFACKAIVTIIDEPAISECALLSEHALKRDWERPGEDEAWSHLQQAP